MAFRRIGLLLLLLTLPFSVFCQSKPLVKSIALFSIDSIGFHYAAVTPTSDYLRGLAVGSDGRVYTIYDSLMTETRQFILADDRHGDVALITKEVYLAGGAAATSPTSMLFDEQGNFYLLEFMPYNYPEGNLVKFNGKAEREIITKLPFDDPGGLARDSDDNFYISDFWNGGIYQVDQQGKLTLFSSTKSYASSLYYDSTQQRLLSAELTAGSGDPTEIFEYSLATGEKEIVATFPFDIRYLAYSSSGDLWGIQVENNGFMRFDSAGNTYHYTVPIEVCNGLAIDPLGNILVAGDIAWRGDIHQLTRTLYIRENHLPNDSLLQIQLANATSSDNYWIIGGNQGEFSMEANSGLLKIADPSMVDFESGPKEYELELRFERNGLFTTEKLNIQLLDEQRPGVLTLEPDMVDSHSAVLKGEVYDQEAAEVSQRGFVLSERPNPTLADSVVYVAGGEGEFSADIACIRQNRRYYVRAFATNVYGTTLGNEIAFTTLSRPSVIAVDSFWLSREDSLIAINWSTKLELEPVQFMVEKAGSDLHFSAMQTVNGNGCTANAFTYSLYDSLPAEGDNYYRLLHKEISGKLIIYDTLYFSYTPPLAAKGRQDADIQIFPNPLPGSRLQLRVPDHHLGQLFYFQIVDVMGRALFPLEEEVFIKEKNALLLPEGLRPGWYMLTVLVGQKSYKLPFLIQP